MSKKTLPLLFILIFIIIFHCERAKNFAQSFQYDTSEIIVFEKMKTHPERPGWGQGLQFIYDYSYRKLSAGLASAALIAR